MAPKGGGWGEGKVGLWDSQRHTYRIQNRESQALLCSGEL